MSSLQLYKKEKERKTKKLPEFYLPTKKKKKIEILTKSYEMSRNVAVKTNERPTDSSSLLKKSKRKKSK